MAIDTGATAWLLAATARVMLMTPGIGFFHGGLVCRKNFISMIALSFIAFALVSIQWVVIGYSLAFGGDTSGFIGNLSNLGGWAQQMGALDFAGCTVVHISSGFGALAIALVIGACSGYGKYMMEPHNIPMSCLEQHYSGLVGSDSNQVVQLQLMFLPPTRLLSRIRQLPRVLWPCCLHAGTMVNPVHSEWSHVQSRD